MGHESPGSGRVEITGERQSIGLPAKVDSQKAEIGAESRCNRFSRPAFSYERESNKIPVPVATAAEYARVDSP